MTILKTMKKTTQRGILFFENELLEIEKVISNAAPSDKQPLEAMKKTFTESHFGLVSLYNDIRNMNEKQVFNIIMKKHSQGPIFSVPLTRQPCVEHIH